MTPANTNTFYSGRFMVSPLVVDTETLKNYYCQSYLVFCGNKPKNQWGKNISNCFCLRHSF